MIDMELFELMKVTLKEVLRHELAVQRNPRTHSHPPAALIADLAFGYALDAKRRLERQRSDPLNDPHAPTLHPPPQK